MGGKIEKILKPFVFKGFSAFGGFYEDFTGILLPILRGGVVKLFRRCGTMFLGW